jgi:hypothetical protein
MVSRPVNNPFATALILLICLGFGLMLALRGWTDRQHVAALDKRGLLANATVTAINSKSVTIAFTAADGQPAIARIRTATAVGVGDQVRVRYDPADPSGNVADPAKAQAAFDRWFLLVSGAMLMLLALHGILWHLLYGQFRPRQGRAAYRDRERDRRQRRRSRK